MHTSELTPAVLEGLRRPRPYPAVSLLMPTHRHRPENAQDPIRLRNLLEDARKRLTDDPQVSRADRIDLEGQLDLVAQDVDFLHAEDGLLVLLAPGERHIWQLSSPVEIQERVVFANTFLTRNLVAARLYARPYWVLVVSEETTLLWEGSGDRLVPVERHGFPLKPGIPDPEDAVPGANIGSVPGHQREERMRQYLRSVDAALDKALDQERRPVFLVGTASTVTLLAELSQHPQDLVGRLDRAGLDKAPAHELSERLRPVFEEYTAKRNADGLEELDSARGRRRFAGGLDEAWRAVTEGRGSLLLVEEHFQAAARIQDGHLVPVEGGTAADGVEEDVVDQLIEAALDKETEVRFVPDDSLSDDGRVALVLRY
ncbi:MULTISPECIES: baeRF3 domain-containing protein [unclassified Streptomyces]|uniref:baeRF3 domain-containing protein n=1 Tax=unclassified Streptomyces TaxID=2593676 RepID=UPI00203376BB|nr:MULTISPECIES: hypothetical protein [unclassified Streptomyces]MCM2423380.1 hypothetical protein [Streptomyces sp. RKAG293]MCM2424407.1 hypothetical protein [Streptomyces sp. RKAG337]